MSNGNNGNDLPSKGGGNDGNGYLVTKTVTPPFSEKTVFDACIKLKSTGISVSTRNVYQLLHHGSFRDIQKYVNRFKELELKEQLQTLEQDNRFSDTVKILAEMLAENAVKQRIDADEKDKSRLKNLLISQEAEHHKQLEDAYALLDEERQNKAVLEQNYNELNEKYLTLSKAHDRDKVLLSELSAKVRQLQDTLSLLQPLKTLLEMVTHDPKLGTNIDLMLKKVIKMN